MKYYIIAGEASGDLHASKLMAGIKKRDEQAEFRFWGGEKMETEGGTLVKHYRDLAFMGFIEVVMNLRTIAHNLRFCKDDIVKYKPDAVILVDYPGFNMRIAKYAKALGMKVFYYISPQVWAWKKRRVHSIHRDTDLAFVVLPFEKEFHARYGYHVEFTGHPMPDSLDSDIVIDEKEFRQKNGLDSRPIIALLPGSRKQELKRILPIMLRIVDKFTDFQFVIAGVNSLEKQFYDKLLPNHDVKVIFNQTHDLLRSSRGAAVASGTATLETAMLNVPQVVCYRMSFLSALIAWMVVKIEFVSLVNLILGRKCVTELIQYKFTAENLARELKPLLDEGKERQKMLSDYKELGLLIGSPGASDRAAAIIVNKMNNTDK